MKMQCPCKSNNPKRPQMTSNDHKRPEMTSKEPANETVEHHKNEKKMV